MNYNKKRCRSLIILTNTVLKFIRKCFLNEFIKTDITRLLSSIDSDLQEGMIETLSYYAENFSANYTKNIFQSLVYLSKISNVKK
jgi:hypothetical protein